MGGNGRSGEQAGGLLVVELTGSQGKRFTAAEKALASQQIARFQFFVPPQLKSQLPLPFARTCGHDLLLSVVERCVVERCGKTVKIEGPEAGEKSPPLPSTQNVTPLSENRHLPCQKH